MGAQRVASDIEVQIKGLKLQVKDLEYKVEKLRKDKGSFEEKVKVAKVIVCLRFLCNCINQAKVIVLGGSFEAHYTKVVQGGEIISDVDEDDNGDDVEEEKEINYDGDDDDEKEKVVDVNCNAPFLFNYVQLI